MTEIRQFPWDRLEPVEPAHAVALRGWAAAGPARDLAGSIDALTEVIGARAELSVGLPRAGALPPEAAIATVLLEGEVPVAMTLEGELADELIGRALGAEVPEGAVGPLGELERGVLAYVIGRWLAGSPWRVVAVLAHPAPIVAAGLELRWPLTVTLDGAAHPVSLWLGPRAPTRAPRWGAHLNDVVVTITPRVGWARLSASAIEALRIGDVIVPDALSMGPDGGSARLWVGTRSWDARAEGTAWRVTERRDAMDEAELLRDAANEEVELTVELARLTKPLAEIAGLAPGAVIETGAAIGGEVTLRAGGAVVARGELVAVDGELGVRILALES